MKTPEEIILEDLEKQLEGETEQKENENEEQKTPEQKSAPQQDSEYLKKLDELKSLITQTLQTQQQQQQAEDKTKLQSDEVLERLKRMTPAERAEWATQNGQMGVLKLMELQDQLYREELEKVKGEAKTSVHESIVDEWAAKNEDLFKDEELAGIVEGIERTLLRKAGVTSYKELSPGALRKHLETVEKKAKEIAKKLGKLEEKKEDKDKDDDKRLDTAFRSIGDVSGVAGEKENFIDVTKLSGFDLESLPLDKLKQLEQKLLMQ